MKRHTTALILAAGLLACGGSSSSSASGKPQSVLLAGGLGPNGASTELYKVAAHKFAHKTATMNEGRFNPAAALLHNGKVLIAGGVDLSSSSVVCFNRALRSD